MRDLKFRAWLSGKHESLTFGEDTMEYNVSVGKIGGYLDIESGWDIHGEYETIPIMQFTGLKDKDGKEIYEGDIIKNVDRNGGKPHEVKFRLGKFVGDYGTGYDLADETIKVIGNIYENQER